MVPSGEDEVVTIVRDFTEQRRAQAEAAAPCGRAGRAPARRDARRRRFAARRGLPDRHRGGLQAARPSLPLMLRYLEDARTATIVGKFGDPPDDFLVGSRLELSRGSGAARPADRQAPPRRLRTRSRASSRHGCAGSGYRASVGVPISVGGAIWGALIAGSAKDERCPTRPSGGCRRSPSWSPWPSRARRHATSWRLAAPDRRGGRRRAAPDRAQPARRRPAAPRRALDRAADRPEEGPQPRTTPRSISPCVAAELSEALTELRELAQGIHPAVLTDRGLGTAVEVLAARTPLRVALDVELAERLPERSRRPPTTSSPRRSPTSSSTRAPRGSRPHRSWERAALVEVDRRRCRRSRSRRRLGPARTARPRRGALREARGREHRGSGHVCPRGAPAADDAECDAAVIADDSALCARGSRGCSRRRASTSSARPATPTSCC